MKMTNRNKKKLMRNDCAITKIINSKKILFLIHFNKFFEKYKSL